MGMNVKHDTPIPDFLLSGEGKYDYGRLKPALQPWPIEIGSTAMMNNTS